MLKTLKAFNVVERFTRAERGRLKWKEEAEGKVEGFVVLERCRNIQVIALKILAGAGFYLYVIITWF